MVSSINTPNNMSGDPQFNPQGAYRTNPYTGQVEFNPQPQRPGMNPQGFIHQNPYFHPQMQQQMQQQQRMSSNGIFNNNDFVQVRQSGDIVNLKQELYLTNYIALVAISSDKETNRMYFSNPDYVWELFRRLSSPDGMWVGTVYVSFDMRTTLVLTTQRVTLHVNKTDMYFVRSADSEQPMSTDDIKDGLIPILQTIEQLYGIDEENKREAEVARLKSQEGRPTEVTEPQEAQDTPTSGFIKLHTRKIRNTKSNYSKFLKEISKDRPGLQLYLHQPTRMWIILATRELDRWGTRLYTVDNIPSTSGFFRVEDGSIHLRIDKLHICLNDLENSPMLQFFEYADLRDPEIITATARMCELRSNLDEPQL